MNEHNDTAWSRSETISEISAENEFFTKPVDSPIYSSRGCDISASFNCELQCVYVDHFRNCLRDTMLTQIAMFSLDPDFQQLAHELASITNISVNEASDLLWPTTHAIYSAAEGGLTQ